MMKNSIVQRLSILLISIIILLGVGTLFAPETASQTTRTVKVSEADGSPFVTIGNLVVPNGSLSTSGSTATVAFNLTDSATGILPPANGGVANVNTVDQGYFFGVTIKPPEVVNALAITGTNNQVRAYQFVLPYRVVVARIAIEITTLSGGSIVDIGIYNAAGTTKVLSLGGITGGGTGVISTSITPVTLDPGVYFFAQVASDTTVAARVAAIPAASATILNANAVEKVGTAANAATAGVLPSSLGVITSATFNPVATVFER
jgi:hypothetical protein